MRAAPRAASDSRSDAAAAEAAALDVTFPRAARMLSAGDFAGLRGASRRVTSQSFVAEISTVESAAPRLGLAVSRKVSKKAVCRNRIKRIARASFRSARGTLPPVDILLIARLGASAQANERLHAELAALWGRIATLNATLNRPEGPGTMRA